MDIPKKRLVGWKQYLYTLSKRILLRWTARGLFGVGLLCLLISVWPFTVGLLLLMTGGDPLGGLGAIVAGGLACGLGLGAIWVTGTVETEAQKVEPVELLTRHNAKHLPEGETLVRGSRSPSADQLTELLRAARQEPETPPEQLLRATQHSHDQD